MINWLIKLLGGYTIAEMNHEKIKNLMAQAELIDAHQKQIKEIMLGHPVLYRRYTTAHPKTVFIE